MITLHEHVIKSKKLVITFGGLPSSKTKTGFGTDFALKLGFDTIYVAQAANTQYQGLSLEDFYKHIEDIIQGRECITYGSSLGAYSAIYYGGIINALIIAAAPKNSAHPSLAYGKFKNISFKHKELKDIPKSLIPPVLIYDPYHKEEVSFIEKHVRPAYDSLRIVQVPFSGHTVLNTMKLSGVLTSFMVNLIESKKIIPFVMKTDDCYVWNGEVSRFYFSKGEIQSAIKYAERSLEIHLNKEALGYLVNYYVSLKRYDELKKLYQEYVVRKGLVPTQASANIFQKYIK
ncbi:MAG: hypothetical protein KBC57_07445 [Neisseriaceae bacterium]|nr:hypothetical protein [Neisseriaceae bacterium]